MQSSGSRGTGLKTTALEDGKMPLFQCNLCSLRAVHRLNQRADMLGEYTPKWGSDDMECLWEGRGGPLRLRRQLSLPSIFLERKEMLSPTSGTAIACMPTLRLPCSLMSSEELAKLDSLSSWWPHSGGTRHGS